MPKKSRRLLELLLEQGQVADVKVATGLIMAGRVVCDGVVVEKPGQLVPLSADVRIRGVQLKYASRGGYKLARALAHFRLDAAGMVALDAGASTGGFTDCLLQAGAACVYAVDVGYGQLRGALATDPRVRVLERTNISDLALETFAEPIDLCVVDVSYLSLLKAIPILAACFVKPVRMVCLIKPLYEGLRREKMADRESMAQVLTGFFQALAGTPFRVRDVVVSPILGGHSAVEFLVWVDDQAQLGPSPAALSATALDTWAAQAPLPPERIDELR